MSTREKILVGLMLVSVCLGGLLLFGDNPEQKSMTSAPGKPDTLIQMLTNLTAQFGNDNALKGERYTLSMARTPWENKLFLDSGDILLPSTAAPATAEMLPSNLSLVYSGYIETPQRRVAIINGIEYLEGETVDQSRLVVRHIDAKRVVLGDAANKVFSVPLEDEWEAPTP
jgi:hypothetical protein